MIGQQVRHYRIESLLGTGGMGSVYLAVHTQLGRKIAIKVIHPALARNPVVRERFRNEAAALSHLQHPNIVALYDYSEEEDALYLFIEYVEGNTLDDYVRTVTGPVPEAKAMPMFAKLLDAVSYAHDRGVIHRDIKPSNIMVDEAGNAKILDFGIAKIIGQGLDGLTKDGTRMGTVLYMSPEQVRGEILDKRSDVYSLGVTLFQVLTGRPPYDEANMTEYAVYQRILHEPLPRMQELYPLVSDRMQAVVDQATAKDPTERFADCHQFREALFAQTVSPITPTLSATSYATPSESLHAGPASLRETTVTPKAAAASKPTKSRTATWLGVLVAVGILFSIIGIMVALLSDEEDAHRADTAPISEEIAPFEHTPEVEPSEEELQEEVVVEMPPPDTVSQTIQKAPDSSVNTPEQRTEQLSKIRLECESVPPSTDSLEDTRFAVKLVLTNTSSEAAFDNVTLQIKFFGENNELRGTYIYEHGHLDPGATERFNIDRRVQAARATCQVLSADQVTPVN